MKISKTYRPELAATQQRGAFFLDARARRLIAMDDQVVLVLPVALSLGERSGFVGAETLRAARRREPGEEQANVNGKPQAMLPGTQPEWRGLVPGTRRGDRGTTSVTLNIATLRRLADAMGVVSVTLTVPARKGRRPGPVVVQPVDPKALEVGVLLPEKAGKPLRVRPGTAKVLRRTKGDARPNPKDLDDAADAFLQATGSGDLVVRELR